MKRVFIFLSIVLFLIFIPTISAVVTCNPSSISVSYVQGNSTNSSILCSNAGNSSVNISKIGGFFTISDTIIGQSPNQKTIVTTFSSLVSAGNYSGGIIFSDGSPLISVLASVNPQQQQTQSGILIFPTTKVISVQQGNEKTQNILITVPQTYPRTITISSVDLNPSVETIKFGDLNLGQIAPGQSINIPLIFSGINAQTGTYITNLNIFATDSGGQVSLPTVSLQLQVTAGINPTTNFSLAELPTCSLSAIELNLNNTYKFTCTIPNPNVNIRPVIDSFYLQGVNVERTSSQFIYTFKARNLGNTLFKADFIFDESPIGNPFEQQVRISPSGNSPIPGITIDFEYYQKGRLTSSDLLGSGEVIIQVVDNSTRNLITNYELYIGGVISNNTLNLEPGREYQLRAISPGYLDAIKKIFVSQKNITITLSPEKTFYIIGESVNITTDANATLYLENIQISPLYIFQSSGNKTIRAVKEGYLETEKVILVKEAIFYITSSPEVDDWGKNDEVVIKLNQNTSWQVFKDGQLVVSGEGDLVRFKINGYGNYEIKSGEILIFSKSVIKISLWQRIKDNVGWIIIGFLVVGAVLFIFFRGGGEEKGEEVLSY